MLHGGVNTQSRPDRSEVCYRMGAALHFRLLLVLCNDVASGGALRAEFQARIDEATQLSTQHRQLLIEVDFTHPASFRSILVALSLYRKASGFRRA